MKTFIIIILCLACIALGYCAANVNPRIEYETLPPEEIYLTDTEYITLPPIEITETEYVILPPEIIEKIGYVDRIVEVIKEVPMPIPFRQFESLIKLKEWVAQYELPELASDADCDDRAMAMAMAALNDGFYLDTEIVEGQLHLIGKTVINNEYYFIDIGKDGTKIIARKMFGMYFNVD